MKKSIFNQFLLLILLPLTGAAQVQFTASVDSKQVPVGEVFEIKFTLENGKGSNFRPPAFSEFNVASGPNKMNSMTIVNGNSRSSEAFSYVLQAKREGVFTIGTATIDVNGTTYKTAPLSISVEKGKRQTPSDLKGSGKDDIFIRAEVSSPTAYVGQQIVLDYKLYTRVNISGVTRVNESKYDGFFKLEVNDYPHGDNRVTVGGKAYIARVLQRIALFPQREGSFKIEPFSLQMGIIKGNQKESDDPFSIFSAAPVENRVIAANEVTINIKPLPTPSPANFSGAVGEFKTDFFVSKTTGTTDDVISLKMNVVGNGDAKRWQAPKLAAVEGLEIYDAKILKEESIERNGEWQTIKEIEYLIVPKQAGQFSIKPEFSYLDTYGTSRDNREGDYKTETKTFDLTIAQGTNKAATLLQDRVRDILGIKTATVFVNQVVRFWGSALFWALFIIPFLLLAGVVVYKEWQIRQSKRDVTLLKRANAPKVAESRLAVAQEFLKKGNERLFYNEISKVLFNYVSDKFGIPLADFTKHNVQEKLTSLNVKELHVQDFVKILNDCEIALFAGRNTEGSAEAIYNRAAGVIVDIEEDLK